MSSIDGVGGPSPSQMGTQEAAKEKDCDDDGGFRSALSKAASGVSKVAGTVPGGSAVGLAAEGVSRLAGGSDDLPGAQGDQMEQMFEMQKQSQAFNMQYLELQNQMQEDNRRFSTLSNLMKVRHDTAKSAINNMHA